MSLEGAKSIREVYEFTDNHNMTPLLIAAKFNNLEIVKFMIKEGVNVYA
jgi:ankyrin repeat protein